MNYKVSLLLTLFLVMSSSNGTFQVNQYSNSNSVQRVSYSFSIDDLPPDIAEEVRYNHSNPEGLSDFVESQGGEGEYYQRSQLNVLKRAVCGHSSPRATDGYLGEGVGLVAFRYDPSSGQVSCVLSCAEDIESPLVESFHKIANLGVGEWSPEDVHRKVGNLISFKRILEEFVDYTLDGQSVPTGVVSNLRELEEEFGIPVLRYQDRPQLLQRYAKDLQKLIELIRSEDLEDKVNFIYRNKNAEQSGLRQRTRSLSRYFAEDDDLSASRLRDIISSEFRRSYQIHPSFFEANNEIIEHGYNDSLARGVIAHNSLCIGRDSFEQKSLTYPEVLSEEEVCSVHIGDDEEVGEFALEVLEYLAPSVIDSVVRAPSGPRYRSLTTYGTASVEQRINALLELPRRFSASFFLPEYDSGDEEPRDKKFYLELYNLAGEDQKFRLLAFFLLGNVPIVDEAVSEIITPLLDKSDGQEREKLARFLIELPSRDLIRIASGLTSSQQTELLELLLLTGEIGAVANVLRFLPQNSSKRAERISGLSFLERRDEVAFNIEAFLSERRWEDEGTLVLAEILHSQDLKNEEIFQQSSISTPEIESWSQFQAALEDRSDVASKRVLIKRGLRSRNSDLNSETSTYASGLDKDNFIRVFSVPDLMSYDASNLLSFRNILRAKRSDPDYSQIIQYYRARIYQPNFPARLRRQIESEFTRIERTRE